MPVVESIQIPLTCSDNVLLKPTSVPSKYVDHVPLVVAPNVVAAKESMSSPFPDAPVTLYAPDRLTTNLPLGAKPMASTSSDVVDNPTSEPSKYQVKVPAVFVPSEVGVKRRISESSTVPKPVTVPSVSRLINIVPLDIKANASTSLVIPTSEPSKYIDQIPVALFRDKISSSAKVTPPTTPSVVELT